jgi:hypothetical protein
MIVSGFSYNPIYTNTSQSVQSLRDMAQTLAFPHVSAFHSARSHGPPSTGSDETLDKTIVTIMDCSEVDTTAGR